MADAEFGGNIDTPEEYEVGCCCGIEKRFAEESWGFSTLPYGLQEDEWPRIWNQSPWDFLTLDRLLMCKGANVMYMTIIFFWSIDSYSGTSSKYGLGYWFIYLTHWQVLIIYAHLLMSFGMTMYYSHVDHCNEPLTRGAKLSWFLQNICVGLVPIVCIQYWALVYSPPLRAVSVHTHGVTWILLTFDLSISYTPTYFKHIWQCAIIAFVYIAFNMIYVLSGGENELGDNYVYSVLSWSDDFGSAFGISFGVIFICCPIIYFLVALFNLWTDRSGYFVLNGPRFRYQLTHRQDIEMNQKATE